MHLCPPANLAHSTGRAVSESSNDCHWETGVLFAGPAIDPEFRYFAAVCSPDAAPVFIGLSVTSLALRYILHRHDTMLLISWLKRVYWMRRPQRAPAQLQALPLQQQRRKRP